MFVVDVAAANLVAATIRAPPHREYNVGTGVEVSVLELVTAVASAAGLDPAAFTPELAPGPAQASAPQLPGCQSGRRELGLGRTTPLQDGLDRTVVWLADRHTRTGRRLPR